MFQVTTYSMFWIVIAALVARGDTQASLRRVCYYTNWSQHRFSAGRFFPENIDANLCTHYIFAFATLSGNNITQYEYNDESTSSNIGMYERFQNIKVLNPSLKTLLGVGGWTTGSAPFSQMATTTESRAQFAQSTVDYLRKWHFDGLDIDWEYPAEDRNSLQDRDNFAELVKEVRLTFDQEAASTAAPRLLLSVAIPAGKDKIDLGFDVPVLNRYVDFINFMTFDLHGSWETITGHHTALFPRTSETGADRFLNVDFAASYLVQKGANPEKVNIGLATYGRTFTLVIPSANEIGAPSRDSGEAGPYTRERGLLAYYEICQMIANGAEVHTDAEQHVHYVTSGNQWVGADDEDTIKEKVCYIKEKAFGGVMVWSVDLDDFAGAICGHGPYPLLNAINSELRSTSNTSCPQFTTIDTSTIPPTTTTEAPTSPTELSTTTATTVQQTTAFSCQNMPSDFYPDPTSCDHYFICANEVIHRVRCTGGLLFNAQDKYCDIPSNVNCTDASTQSTTHLTAGPTTTEPTAGPTTAEPTAGPTSTQSTTEIHTPPLNPVTTHTPLTPISTEHNIQPGQGQTPSEFCAHKDDGQYRYPSDCNKYIVCVMGMGFLSHCPQDYVFSQAAQTCEQYAPDCGP